MLNELEAVKQNGFAIECIENPSEKAQPIAVKLYEIILDFI